MTPSFAAGGGRANTASSAMAEGVLVVARTSAPGHWPSRNLVEEATVRSERHDAMLDILRRATGPVPGPVLAAQLRTSTRSVRQYVKEINTGAACDVIAASHRGYQIDERVARQVVDHQPGAVVIETPLQRLYYIARRLLTSRSGEDVFELAELLAVSEATVEADLAKVRTLLRQFDLTLRRERTVARIEGSEPNQRRLMRRVVLESAHGVAAVGLTAAVQQFHQYDLAGLSRLIDTVLREHGIELNEYALGDLGLHVVIALDRIAAGHAYEPVEPDRLDPRVTDAVDALATGLEDHYGHPLGHGERLNLARMIAARTAPGPEPGAGEDPYVGLVREITRALSDQYLLDLDDDMFALNLSLHVRNLVARARTGQRARNPLRTSFKQSHPLIHELAVFVASKIEQGTGIAVDEDEIVFLSLHLGTYLQKRLEGADRVTVTCVVPRYYDVHVAFGARIAELLGETATLADTLTSLHPDWAGIDTDLIVSTIDAPPDAPAEVVHVGAVPTRADLDRVAAAVRAARERKQAARIRWTMSELFDPRLFRRVERISKDDALRLMCDDLGREGVTAVSFHEDVLERERLSPTAFGGAIAVPHSLRMDSSRTAISVLISEEPILWSESRVHLVALFALSPTGRHVFRDVLDQFIATLADPLRLSRIIDEGTTYDRFVRTVLRDPST
jgi:lichenan operon transcriptional antiterminator